MTGPRRAVLALALLLAAAPPAAAAAPEIGAPAAVLVQPDTGDTVYARAPDARRAIASTTKLMTALLTVERGRLSGRVAAVPYPAAAVESVIGLRAGERLTRRDLLRGLLLASANDAAATLAVDVAGSRAAFVRAMNARARSLGLRRTSFANPVGLDAPGNFSTARDLVVLARAVLRDPFLRATVDRPRATLRSGDRERRIVNRNALVRRVPAVAGVKTGRTQGAGYVLVGAARRDGVEVLSAVLGASSEAARDADSLALLRHGLARYRRTAVVRRGARVAAVPLRLREDESVDLVAARTVRRVVRRGQRVRVEAVGVPAEVDGPLAAGARLGTAVVRAGGGEVVRVPLVTSREVAEAGLGDRLGGTSPAVLAVVLVGLAGSLQLAVLRRRARRRRTRRRRRSGTEPAA